MKYVYLGISLACIVTIGFCVYYFLGGFEPIEVVEVNETKFTVLGKPYKGKYYKADSLIKIQDGVVGLIRDDKVSGDFAQVNYLANNLSDEEVDLFIGVLFYDAEIQVPGGYSVREFGSKKMLAVKLSMFYAVRPDPNQVQAAFYQYARENGLELEEYFLEITFQDNTMEVYGFVKS